MKFGIVKWLPAALLAACLPAGAQTITPKIHANIPFNFVAGGQYLQAGQYTVAPAMEDTRTTWRITSDDDRVSVSMITHETDSPVKSHRRSLMFQQLGSRYVLTEFWTGEHTGREMPMPSRQTLEAASGKTVEVAAE